MADKPFGFRPAVREQAEQNMKEAHPAHEQFTDLVTKAMDAWKGAMRAGLEAARSKDVQDRAVEITKRSQCRSRLLFWSEKLTAPELCPPPTGNGQYLTKSPNIAPVFSRRSGQARLDARRHGKRYARRFFSSERTCSRKPRRD